MIEFAAAVAAVTATAALAPYQRPPLLIEQQEHQNLDSMIWDMKMRSWAAQMLAPDPAISAQALAELFADVVKSAGDAATVTCAEMTEAYSSPGAAQ